MDFEAELQTHDGPLLRASDIGSHEHVLDIGCGTGQTTRAAARCAVHGSALGLDVTQSMIVRARANAAAEGLTNVRFEYGDAQVHALPTHYFDLAISRYGTMFFADPIAAFRNLRSTLLPSGRLVMMVWQAHDVNEWSVAIQRALAPFCVSQPDTHSHFSLADPHAVEHILAAAQFVETQCVDVREPVYYGADAEAAVNWVRGFRFVRHMLQGLDEGARARALEKLRETLATYCTGNGVWIDAREWIVTARLR